MSLVSTEIQTNVKFKSKLLLRSKTMLVARSKFPSFWFKGEIRWFFWWEADWRLFVHKLIFERLDVYSLVQNDLQNPLWFYTSWTSWLLHVINCIKVNTEWVEKMSNYQSILCLSGSKERSGGFSGEKQTDDFLFTKWFLNVWTFTRLSRTIYRILSGSTPPEHLGSYMWLIV